ncbi:MAG: HAD-IIB family hydrolase [Anaplasmataceae bacterium]|nr:HAD-IIB family hydrolase [Anaplasmataceae bacterium]
MVTPLPSEIKDKELIVFDLDGTLTVSKSPLDEEMAGLLKELLKKKKVAIISGGFFPQHQKQVIPFIGNDEEILKNLFLFPATSTVFVRYENSNWNKVYENVMSSEEKEKIYQAFDKVFQELNYQKPSRLYGVDIEDRGTQISFSPLGQHAPVELKEAWRFKNDSLRQKIRNRLAELLPQFEVRNGGITTIDITHQGIDKAYGVRKIEEHLHVPIDSMVFVGDALEEGGNDEAVKKTGIQTIKVKDSEETKQVIRQFLNE